MIHDWDNSCEIAPWWLSLDLTADRSTLVQVMAWCVRQQAITWNNVDPDLCHHMTLLGLNELMGVEIQAISWKAPTYLISIWLHIDSPLVSVAIFLSFFTKITSQVAVDDRFDNGDTLQYIQKHTCFEHVNDKIPTTKQPTISLFFFFLW